MRDPAASSRACEGDGEAEPWEGLAAPSAVTHNPADAFW